uniref:mitogen-activated protein kinase kinase n=1 Tax=Eutreptiella gymnastica TaxID=73025 RepID=A0A7S1IN49_9EUGL|mmetsp:Transcript_28841/g.51782  ORF Transcript_28841/g.51782 Transcript_28841/m.51782 type:complete len:615 (+) Transcript_28841:75-1919(+)
MAENDVATLLLQQKLLKEQARDKKKRMGPSLNIASSIQPVRQLTSNHTILQLAQRPTGSTEEGHGEKEKSQTDTGAQAQKGKLEKRVGNVVDFTSSTSSTATSSTATMSSSNKTRSRHRITDTGSLHILGDDRVLISVKDAVNVHPRDKEEDKAKKYVHLAEHKKNVNKRIEYKHLQIPEGMHGVLGQGTQGMVKKVIHKPTGTTFALKILSTESGINSRQLASELEHVLQNQKKKEHCKYLVTSYEAFFRSTKLCILMELMEYGSLADVLKMTTLVEPEAAVVSYHVLQGLMVLQAAEIIHRDIKPGNLLINDKGICKIADFGVSGITNSLNLANSSTGTQLYMSPERLDLKDYSYQADIWSFGLCLAQAVCGNELQWCMGDKPPQKFTGPGKPSFFDMAVAIANKNFRVHFDDTGPLSDNLKMFVADCMHHEWEHRPLAGKLVKYPFLDIEGIETATLQSTLLPRLDSLKTASPKSSQPHGLRGGYTSMQHPPTPTSTSSVATTPTSGTTSISSIDRASSELSQLGSGNQLTFTSFLNKPPAPRVSPNRGIGQPSHAHPSAEHSGEVHTTHGHASGAHLLLSRTSSSFSSISSCADDRIRGLAPDSDGEADD